MSRTSSPAAKRAKLHFEDNSSDPARSEVEEDLADARIEESDESENSCSICLQPIEDRTVIPTCSHEFCFDCLLVWTEQSRRCPLCSQSMGEYLIHSIRSRHDYRKHFLVPLRTSPTSRSSYTRHLPHTREHTRRRRNPPTWGRPNRDGVPEELDRLERSILKRRWIYQHNLYAKHVASNAFTKYRPYPTPSQFAASQDLISRTTSFLRRELQVWEGLDVEFLTTLIVSLMKSIDIRSESAVKLISEFLDMDEPYRPGGRHRNAEHFAHEVYSYVRSPYKDLFVYDDVVQYDAVPGFNLPAPEARLRGRHDAGQPDGLRQSSPPRHGRSPSPSLRHCTPNRSLSWSPSGRRYSPKGSGTYKNPPLWNLQASTHHKLPTVEQQVISQTDRTRSSKGKERAIEPGEGLSESSKNIQRPKRDLTSRNNSLNDQSTFDTDVPGKLLNVLRPSRNPSLIQSVKAHLSKNAASSSGPEVNRDRHLGADDTRDADRSQHQQSVRERTYSNTDRPPVLLARLSEPLHPALLSRLSDPCSSPIMPPFLAQATSSLSSFSSELSICGAAQLSGESPESSGRLPEPRDSETFTPGPSLSSLEARAKLLARLNREKKQARTHGLSTSISPTSPHSMAEQTSDPSYREESDTLTMEATLRSQAQQRARLREQKNFAASSQQLQQL